MRQRARQAFIQAVGCLAVALLYCPSALAVDARELYRLGLELYDERQYENALEKFEASYLAQESPNSKLYVARCLRAVGRTRDAIDAYELSAQLAFNRISTESRYEQTYLSALRELAVLKPPPPPQQRYVAATATAAGVGTLGLVSFAIFAGIAQSNYRSLQSHCHPLPCPASEAGKVEAGRNYQLIANVSLAVGGSGAIAAVFLYILGRPRLTPYGALEVSTNALQFSGEF